MRYAAESMEPSFLAGIIEHGYRHLSGVAAGRLLEQNASLSTAAGRGAFDLWRLHFQERILELSTALAFDRPELFAAGATWSRQALAARRLPANFFEDAGQVLEEVVREQVPSSAAPLLEEFLAQAQRSAGQPPEAAAAEEELGVLALSYLEQALLGNSRQAIDLLRDGVEGPDDVLRIFETVLAPVQREVGGMWHRGELNVAEEHVATLTTQKAIAVLAQQATATPSNGRVAVSVSATGDTHDLGLRLVGELFELAGWRSLLFGADVPRQDAIQLAVATEADLVLLSATLTRHLRALRSLVRSLRETPLGQDVKILVGGRAFGLVPDLWRDLGADGFAESLGEAVALGSRLVGLDGTSS